ncbi:alpha/beta hydrolase fold domain-containing protein [Streptomyces somaliensis]|uniref:alpha/beta hydrolase fold domain-containing protein n=1 Tax=Streptomyces somaliensis TaxID=78355 RepID=UPI00281540A2|nr:alpha/beta hydrolase fold domain-containing protein [Streptomyces somaliensis]
MVHLYGGGFAGTAVQCDWTHSRLAARLPALVFSVEHRLLAPGSLLSNAADDGWDVPWYVPRRAAQWGVDTASTAVFGESRGVLVSAPTAVRARRAGPGLTAQVLVGPVVGVAEAMSDRPSVTEYGHGPALTLPRLRLFRRPAVPPEADARAVSPPYAGDPGGPAPALVVVPARDAAAATPNGRARRGPPRGFPSTGR